MPKEYSLEHYFKVWTDMDGTYVGVGPDCDGLSLLEITIPKDFNSESIDIRVTMEPEMALILADAIRQAATIIIAAAENG